MPAPAGSFQFVYPKIIAGTDGDIHLVWAEFDSTRYDAVDWAEGRKTSLWHSVLTRGQWSAPERIYRADDLQWTKDAGHVAIDGSGELDVVVYAFTQRTHESGVVRVHHGASGWTTALLPYRAMSGEVAILSHDDSIVVLFGGTSFGPTDSTGVTLIESSDRGVTWTRPVVVRRLAGRSADHPQVVRNEKGTFLVWSEAPPHQFGRDTLRIVRLDDWPTLLPIASIPLPAGSSTFSVTSTACGDLEFLVSTLSQTPRTLEMSVTARGVVSQQWLLSPEELSMFSGVGATRHSLTAVLAIRSQPGTPARAVTMTRPTCFAN